MRKQPFIQPSEVEREFWRIISASYSPDEVRAVKRWETEMVRLVLLTSRRAK